MASCIVAIVYVDCYMWPFLTAFQIALAALYVGSGKVGVNLDRFVF